MSSVSRASGIAELPDPVAVCCHDAGGANLIAAWAAAHPERAYRICAQGPAREIFARALPRQAPLPLAAALADAACLLSGSGWASDLEHEARVAAARLGVPALAVLDHWVNYRARFTRNSHEALPDVFIVTDAAAAQLAAGIFGATRPIIMWNNTYLENEVARVAALATQPTRAPPERLLVVLEPVRTDWQPGSSELPEFRALDYLLASLGRLTPRPASLAIRLRPHPSETAGKYQPWVARARRAGLELSSTAALADDLAWADAVAGLNSYALVVAQAAGRRAVSYLPPGAPPCLLRWPGIEPLSAPGAESR